MTELKYIHFSNKKTFHDWLQKNHEKSPGIWMVYYKKHANKECISYDEALNEALCFGWIDSIIKRIDDDKYARKFTPRTDTANWSIINNYILHEFAQNEPALSNFNKLSKTYQRPYILWIMNARKKDTIHKRLKESIELLKENKKLGLK